MILCCYANLTDFPSDFKRNYFFRLYMSKPEHDMNQLNMLIIVLYESRNEATYLIVCFAYMRTTLEGTNRAG